VSAPVVVAPVVEPSVDSELVPVDADPSPEEDGPSVDAAVSSDDAELVAGPLSSRDEASADEVDDVTSGSSVAAEGLDDEGVEVSPVLDPEVSVPAPTSSPQPELSSATSSASSLFLDRHAMVRTITCSATTG
jgi:hypothetical protein